MTQKAKIARVVKVVEEMEAHFEHRFERRKDYPYLFHFDDTLSNYN